MVAVRSMVALAASKGLYIYKMDVHNAFLNASKGWLPLRSYCIIFSKVWRCFRVFEIYEVRNSVKKFS